MAVGRDSLQFLAVEDQRLALDLDLDLDFSKPSLVHAWEIKRGSGVAVVSIQAYAPTSRGKLSTLISPVSLHVPLVGPVRDAPSPSLTRNIASND